MISKARRTTSGGGFTHMGNGVMPIDNGDWISPPPSIFAMYQADLYDMNHKPKWYGHYAKLNRCFIIKLKAFSRGIPISVSQLQSSLSMDHVYKYFYHI